MYCNIFDSHLHSENSYDGNNSVTVLAETAIEKGILGIAVTDHCEGECMVEENFESRIRRSALDTSIAKQAYKDRLIVSLGVEVGQVFYSLEAVERILDSHSFDFVLGSLHRLKCDRLDFYEADYSKLSLDTIAFYLEKYFEELLDLVNWGKIDVLAHLNYPWRYIEQRGVDVDFSRYREHVDTVLKKAVEKGIGIELNMSGVRYGENIMPPGWVLKRYRELGGEIVTIGSDAHTADSLGGGIVLGMRLLEDAGISHFAFFRNRKPVMLRII